MRIKCLLAIGLTLGILTMTPANATNHQEVMTHLPAAHLAAAEQRGRQLTAEGTGDRSPAANVLVPSAGPCSEYRYRHIIPSLGIPEVQRRVKLLIRCAARKWPISLSTAFAIADRESHYYCWAVNPSGSTGVFQVISSTWESWRSSFPWLASVTIDSRLNCRSNVLMSVRVMNAWGYGPWSM